MTSGSAVEEALPALLDRLARLSRRGPSAARAEAFRRAPRGLVDAFAEALGFAGASEAARAAPALARRAAALAEGLSGDRARLCGEGLLPEDWATAPRAAIEVVLREQVEAYLRELLQLIEVSTAFDEVSSPVGAFRGAWGDTVVEDRHALELWGTPDVLAAGSCPWAPLCIGLTLFDGVVDVDVAMRARAELDALAEGGALSDFSRSTCNPGARRLWLHLDSQERRATAPPALRSLCSCLAELPGALAARAARQPDAIEAPPLRIVAHFMAATYGHGAHYVPHLDMYSNGSRGFMNNRLLTVICYLNDWRPGDGGELRVFGARAASPSERFAGPGAALPKLLGISADHSESTAATAHEEEAYVDIPPVMGRIVAFRSRTVWHAIRPSRCSARWALTLWLLADGASGGAH